MRTVEGNSGIHTKDQTRAQAEIESIFSGYLNSASFLLKVFKYEKVLLYMFK